MRPIFYVVLVSPYYRVILYTGTKSSCIFILRVLRSLPLHKCIKFSVDSLPFK